MQFLLSRRTLAVVISVCLLLLLFFTARERTNLTLVERATREAFAPFERLATVVSRSVVGAVESCRKLARVYRENEVLRAENRALRSEVARLEELRSEVQRLRALLGFASSAPYKVVGAQVIARDPGNWLSTVTIGTGTSRGVRKDMPVVTSEGVVGRVISATSHTATVLLIVDPRSAVGGLDQRSRNLVLVEGTADRSGKCLLIPLTADADIRVGDRIVSSGLGGVFPKGLVIGQIESVSAGRFGVSRQAVVEPAVDFARLEEVFVVQVSSDR